MAQQEFVVRLDCTLDRLWERLGDPEVARERAATDSSGGTSTKRHEMIGDKVHVEYESTLPENWLPGAARRRMGRLPRVVRREEWSRDDSAVTGVMQVDVVGIDAQVEGSMRCESEGGGCVVRQNVVVVVPLPILGRIIEAAILHRIGEAAAQEMRCLE